MPPKRQKGVVFKLVQPSYDEELGSDHSDHDELQPSTTKSGKRVRFSDDLWVTEKEEERRKNIPTRSAYTHRREGGLAAPRKQRDDYYDEQMYADELLGEGDQAYFGAHGAPPDIPYTPAWLAERNRKTSAAAAAVPEGDDEWEEWEEEEYEEGEWGDADADGEQDEAEEEEEEEDQEDEPLFAGETPVECELDDDFFRQIVDGATDDAGLPYAAGTGSGDDDDDCDSADMVAENAEGDVVDVMERFAHHTFTVDDGRGIGIDAEAWSLMSKEEKIEALYAAGRLPVSSGANRGSGGVGSSAQKRKFRRFMKDYPQQTEKYRHSVLDRQFARAMQDFDFDMENINDPNLTHENPEDVADLHDVDDDEGPHYLDPRTQGPLPIANYYTALEEFLIEKSGYNYETQELSENRGLLHQLELKAREAGTAFMSGDGGQGGRLQTVVMQHKSRRLMEESRAAAEKVREEARARMAAREKLRQEGVAVSDDDEEQHSDAESEYDIVEVKTRRPDGKHNRLDVETVVSTYSSYYNQPNVIKPSDTGKKKAKKPTKATAFPPRRGADEDEDDDYGYSSGDSDTAGAAAPVVAVPTSRPQNETAEERRQRKKAVKEAQRLRRQEKSALKKAYKEVAASELERNRQAQRGRRTVHLN